MQLAGDKESPLLNRGVHLSLVDQVGSTVSSGERKQERERERDSRGERAGEGERERKRERGEREKE